LIVVDVNALAYLWLPGPFSIEAAACLKKDPAWAAPPLWRSEFRNILAGFLRKGLLDLASSKLAYQKAEKTLNGREFPVTTDEVLDLVLKSDCSAYDCEYAALARRLGVKLVTKDAKLIKAFPRLAVDLEVFAKS
jgi:predicted nucleic acid-binding protein